MQLQTLIDTYCEAWNQPTEDGRARLLQAVMAPGATYTDPSVDALDISALPAHIGQVLAQRPGCRVVRTSRVDQHHGVARFAWQLVEASGNVLPEGLDIVFLSDDGSRIERIVGFFGPLKKT